MTTTIDSSVKETYLRKQACFSQFTDQEIIELASLLTEKPFNTGDVIVTEGAIVDSVYLIISGEADVRHVYVKEGKIEFDSIAKLGPGRAIGLNDYGFYSLSGVRTATCVALTPMMTLRLSLAAFHGFSLVHTHVSEVMRKNAEEMLRIDNQVK